MKGGDLIQTTFFCTCVCVHRCVYAWSDEHCVCLEEEEQANAKLVLVLCLGTLGTWQQSAQV